jgi:hypothetical protein
MCRQHAAKWNSPFRYYYTFCQIQLRISAVKYSNRSSSPVSICNSPCKETTKTKHYKHESHFCSLTGAFLDSGWVTSFQSSCASCFANNSVTQLLPERAVLLILEMYVLLYAACNTVRILLWSRLCICSLRDPHITSPCSLAQVIFDPSVQILRWCLKNRSRTPACIFFSIRHSQYTLFWQHWIHALEKGASKWINKVQLTNLYTGRNTKLRVISSLNTFRFSRHVPPTLPRFEVFGLVIVTMSPMRWIFFQLT